MKRKLDAVQQDGNGSESPPPPHSKSTGSSAEGIAKTNHSLDPLTSQYFSKEPEGDVRLGEKFFDQPCICLAKAFLGKVSIRVRYVTLLIADDFIQSDVQKVLTKVIKLIADQVGLGTIHIRLVILITSHVCV